jgi:hypothetical protein
MAEIEFPVLSDDTTSARRAAGYALPYYTRLGHDTEYLICNPGPLPVQGSIFVYGRECRPVGEPIGVHIQPTCTQSVRVQPIIPDYAGHAVLDVSRQVVVGIVYLRPTDSTVVGNALAGRSSLVGTPTRPVPATYGFGYRTLPFGPDMLEASLFVSNPNTSTLSGELRVYGENCELLDRQQIRVRPGCTREYRLPVGHFGFGRVRVLAPAVLNLLHFSANTGGLTGAELLDANTEVPEPPPPEAGILIDDTHRCHDPYLFGSMAVWESALMAAGITVDHLTTSPLTAAALQPYRALAVIGPLVAYDPAEVQVISNFVNGGGGLLIGQDFGVDPMYPYNQNPWSLPTRSVMNAFGIIDDSNDASDPTPNHYDGNSGWIRFEAGRNFGGGHPIVAGLTTIWFRLTCTLSGGSAWSAIVNTDTDTNPPSRPVVMERDVGAGRILVLGDSNPLDDSTIVQYENQIFAVRCIERLLFRI